MKRVVPSTRREVTKPQVNETQSFSGYLVCIGDSAGGLDPLESLLKHCPVDTGMNDHLAKPDQPKKTVRDRAEVANFVIISNQTYPVGWPVYGA
jgi:hypothetical protein